MECSGVFESDWSVNGVEWNANGATWRAEWRKNGV